MQIESIELRNYRVFRDARMDRIPQVAVVVGPNGAGKTTLFDVFRFLKECLAESVVKAVESRGGFKELVSRGCENRWIGIALCFRENTQAEVEYSIDIGLDCGRVFVEQETLKTTRSGPDRTPFTHLRFSRGRGSAFHGESDDAGIVEEVTLKDATLGLAVFGQITNAEVAYRVRSCIENWHIAEAGSTAATHGVTYRPIGRISSRSETVAQAVGFMFENHREQFDLVLQRMRERIPGVTNIEVKATADGRILLRLHDASFKDPFSAEHASDGTLKMLAYLVMLHDPSPHPLLAIEGPERHVYPELLAELVEDYRDYARRGGQVFLSTHSPEFLNRMSLDEIHWLVKRDGFSTFEKASDSELLRNLVEEGDRPGTLWKRGLFEAACM